ncbi:MAG: polyphosphate polymerase domain-containing protein [Candidatus Sabulitectum sp.]|nr:polyphosphate polymerase domain-containing protein [Candidatus Sabulitectum sp.]
MERLPENLHFYRYEFKYILGSDRLARVTEVLDNHLSRDRHCSENGDYPIRSVYFDSPDMRWFHEKRNGLEKRFKYRLRTYSHLDAGFSSPLYLELKGRDGSLVIKHRVRLPIEEFTGGIGGGANWLRELLFETSPGNNVAERFIAQSFRYRLAPSVITDYNRAAWEDHTNPDFRATIDTASTAWRTSWEGLPEGIPAQIIPSGGIVEIKFRYRIPFWFQRLIREMELTRISCSKFQRAVEAVYLDHDGTRLNRLIERRIACLH